MKYRKAWKRNRKFQIYIKVHNVFSQSSQWVQWGNFSSLKSCAHPVSGIHGSCCE